MFQDPVRGQIHLKAEGQFSFGVFGGIRYGLKYVQLRFTAKSCLKQYDMKIAAWVLTYDPVQVFADYGEV